MNQINSNYTHITLTICAAQIGREGAKGAPGLKWKGQAGALLTSFGAATASGAFLLHKI